VLFDESKVKSAIHDGSFVLSMGDDDGLTTLKVAEIRQPSDGLKGQLIARLREHAAKLDTAESEPEVTNESNSAVEF
jgi:hypothetical protein